MSLTSEISDDDWRLIHLLANDASDISEIAAQLGTDVAEVERRIRSLREREILSGIQARISPEAVGFPVTAFYVLRVAQNAESYAAVERMLRDIDQVEEAYAVSGQFDWLVKVRAPTVDDLRRVLTEQLALIPGFVRGEAMVVMSTACEHQNVAAALYPRGQ